jgi:hypothetical protein
VLAILFSALAPWVSSRVSFPNEPFDVSVIYRSREGDIQYFPLIAQFARGTITDGTLKETEGSTLRSFPFATLLPHAFSVAVFGQYGFVVADVLVAVAYLLFVVLLCRTVGVSPPLSIIAALCIALRLPIYLFDTAGLPPMFKLWEMRIPRPYVSELYLVMTVVAALALLTTKQARLSHWLLLAAAFGLLLQGDIHGAFILVVASPVVFYYIVKRDGLARTLRSGLYASVLVAVLISPFVAQQLVQHPDIPVRWGVFPVERDGVVEFFRGTMRWRWLVGHAVVSLALLMAISRHAHSRSNAHLEEARRARGVLFYALSLLGAAVVCYPLSILILGSTVQPYHFDDRALRVYSYAVIVLAFLLVDRFVFFRLANPRPYLYATMFIVLALGLGYRLRDTAAFQSHLRPQFFGSHTAATHPSYRESFTELTSFLDRTVPDRAVVASFDHQVFSWWLTFHRGYWFLAEPFVSSASDQELETRLALLCRELGMSPQDYRIFIQQTYINVFWLGLLKYQASHWYTYSSLDDYTPEDRSRIVQSWDFWERPTIPQSELTRLTTAFENATSLESGKRALDVIVLSNRGPEQPWAPPAQTWQLAFRNDGFRVYVAR